MGVSNVTTGLFEELRLRVREGGGGSNESRGRRESPEDSVLLALKEPGQRG